MDSVTDKLLHCFGHRKFKSELQERAVRAINRGKYFSKHTFYFGNVACALKAIFVLIVFF